MDFGGEDPKEKTTEAIVDSLSALPVEVIYQIMEHLTIRDAARMSALSCNWRNIWLSLPCIEFGFRFVLDYKIRGKKGSREDFHSTMNRILLHHQGPIVKFTMDIGLRAFRAHAISAPLKLPPLLFSFSKLRILKLCWCKISIPPTFTGFTHLVCLELSHVIASGGVLGSLIHMSSELEELMLDYCKGFEDVTIDFPLLRQLDVSGELRSICFKNAPNLTVANLQLGDGVDLDYEKARNLINFLASSCMIKALRLGAAFHKLFLERDTCEKLHTFNRLKYLAFDDLNLKNGNGLSYVKCIMRSCPNMTHVLLDLDQGSGEGWIFESDHNFTLDHLRRIKIYGFAGVRTELKLIEFLLKNSPKLVKLKIRKHEDCRPGWELARELMTRPRVSSEAEIIVVND